MPYLIPEIVLLYKAKQCRPSDEADLLRCLPLLGDHRRLWLQTAIDAAHGSNWPIEEYKAWLWTTLRTQLSVASEPAPDAVRGLSFEALASQLFGRVSTTFRERFSVERPMRFDNVNP
jgi:hypothetical protein